MIIGYCRSHLEGEDSEAMARLNSSYEWMEALSVTILICSNSELSMMADSDTERLLGREFVNGFE